jgi:hypothetical protein
MTQSKNITTQPIHTRSLAKRMLIGAGIALLLIIIFLSGSKEPHPEWGKFWIIRPLIVVPFAGATGGAFYYLFEHFPGNKGGWKKALAITMSVIVYVFGLWIGTVLGLAGTMWN